jgi:tetratricopeptide (TPR) repeat protein
MRRFDEARSSAARAVALAPTSLTIAAVPPTVELAAGNLPAAQHALRGAMGNIARDRFLAFMGNYGDQGWMLEEADQQRLLELGVDAFGGDRFAMTTTKALQYWWRGDSTKARLWADSALREIRKELRAEPNDPQRRMYFAQLLAIHGERNAALSALSDAKKLINEGPNRMAENNGGFLAYVAARTAIAVGDREQALAWIRETLARKIYVTAPRLRLDPSFKALRGDPRFEEILNSGP